MRQLVRRAERRGNRMIWWGSPPIWVRVPPWWRWTIPLTWAIAARIVAVRCDYFGGYSEWPPRLPDLARPGG